MRWGRPEEGAPTEQDPTEQDDERQTSSGEDERELFSSLLLGPSKPASKSTRPQAASSSAEAVSSKAGPRRSPPEDPQSNTHTGPKIVTCALCSFQTSSKLELTEHLQSADHVALKKLVRPKDKIPRRRKSGGKVPVRVANSTPLPVSELHVSPSGDSDEDLETAMRRLLGVAAIGTMQAAEPRRKIPGTAVPGPAASDELPHATSPGKPSFVEPTEEPQSPPQLPTQQGAAPEMSTASDDANIPESFSEPEASASSPTTEERLKRWPELEGLPEDFADLLTPPRRQPQLSFSAAVSPQPAAEQPPELRSGPSPHLDQSGLLHERQAGESYSFLPTATPAADFSGPNAAIPTPSPAEVLAEGAQGFASGPSQPPIYGYRAAGFLPPQPPTGYWQAGYGQHCFPQPSMQAMQWNFLQSQQAAMWQAQSFNIGCSFYSGGTPDYYSTYQSFQQPYLAGPQGFPMSSIPSQAVMPEAYNQDEEAPPPAPPAPYKPVITELNPTASLGRTTSGAAGSGAESSASQARDLNGLAAPSKRKKKASSLKPRKEPEPTAIFIPAEQPAPPSRFSQAASSRRSASQRRMSYPVTMRPAGASSAWAGRSSLASRTLPLKDSLRSLNRHQPVEPREPEVVDEDSDLVCPITLIAMQDPVVAEDGHTYEARAIKRWLADKGTSPITGTKIGGTLHKNRFANLLSKFQNKSTGP